MRRISDIPDSEDAKIMREFPDGTKLLTEPWIELKDSEAATYSRYRVPSDRTYWVKTSENIVFEFGEGSRSENKNKAGAMAILWYRSGGFEMSESPSMIPVEIAAMGKPAMAAYLDVVHSTNREKIGEMLEISKGTVEQYISKVRRGHR